MSLRTVFIKIGRAVLQNNTKFSSICVCPQKICYSNKPLQPIVVESISGEELQKKKRKAPIVPRITLLSGKDDISVTTLEEAQKLAKRRDLKLVKILDLDTKTQRPVYKLMTATEYHAEDVKSKKQNKDTGFKGEKMIMMSTAISDHDLQVHIKKIEKWIAKNFEVRIAVSGSSSSTERAVRWLQLTSSYRNLPKNYQ